MKRKSIRTMTLIGFSVFSAVHGLNAQQPIPTYESNPREVKFGKVTYNRFLTDSSSQDSTQSANQAPTDPLSAALQAQLAANAPSGLAAPDTQTAPTRLAAGRRFAPASPASDDNFRPFLAPAIPEHNAPYGQLSVQHSSSKNSLIREANQPKTNLPTTVSPRDGTPLVQPLGEVAGNQAVSCSSAIPYNSSRRQGNQFAGVVSGRSANQRSLDESAFEKDYPSVPPTDYDSNRKQGIFSSFFNRSAKQNCGCDGDIACDCATTERKGLYFGSYEGLLGLPYFSDNNIGLTNQIGGLSVVEPFKYDAIFASRLQFGYESQQGPGFLGEYFNLDADSGLLSSVNTGAITNVTGILNAPQVTPGTFTISPPIGGRLDANSNQHLTSYKAEVFKRIYWPISTLTGGLGLNYMQLDQFVNYSSFATPTSTMALMTLDGQRRFEGIGPSFSMEYYRPIGHTHIAAIGGVRAAVLFGADEWTVAQDQVRLYQNNSNRVLTSLAVRVGTEWSKGLGCNSASRLFIRTTIEGQNWLNAGTFGSNDSDFGFVSGNLAIGLAY